MKKKIIAEQISEITYAIEGPLDDLISYLNSFKKNYPDHSDFYIEKDYNWNEDCDFYVYANRLETDKELEKRRQKAATVRKIRAKQKAQKEEQERKELERLKKKYEM